MFAAKVRHAAHILVALALHYSGALRLLRFLRRGLHGQPETYVLGFHRILTEEEAKQSHSLPAMILHEDVFLDLLRYLKKRSEFIALGGLMKKPNDQHRGASRRFLVTLDDAWLDTYERAIPALEELQIPSVVFVPTGFVGSRGGMWVEQLVSVWNDPAVRRRLLALDSKSAGRQGPDGRLHRVIERLRYMPAEKREQAIDSLVAKSSISRENSMDAMMLWEQLVEIQSRGVEIGSHTIRHPLLPYESDKTVRRELLFSRQELESRLGGSVRAFAYPNGSFDQRVSELARNAGYECAFTAVPRSYKSGDNPYTIPRFLLHNGNVTGFDGKFSPAMLNLVLAGRA